jgi:transitional endoplasmic reticulum ATPase
MDTAPAGEVFIFGATNLVESVDPALRRPGRFDKHLEFFPPNVDGRKKIIEINTRKWKNGNPISEKLDDLAQKTVGFTGADLEKLCREVFFTAFERHVPDDDLSKGIHDLEVRFLFPLDLHPHYSCLKPPIDLL